MTADFFRARQEHIIDLKHPLNEGRRWRRHQRRRTNPAVDLASRLRCSTSSMPTASVAKTWGNDGWRTSSGNTSAARTTSSLLPCDATQTGRHRTAIGEAGEEELLKTTIDTAVVTKAVRLNEFERIIVGSTIQKKAIAHPVDCSGQVFSDTPIDSIAAISYS